MLAIVKYNLTEIQLFWTDPYSEFDGYVWLKVSLTACIALFTFLGTVVNCAIICYERNEGDPQKRSLLNQISAWQLAIKLPISCKSVQPVPVRVEEPVSPARQSSGGGATNNLCRS